MKVDVIYLHITGSCDLEAKRPDFYTPFHKRFVSTYLKFDAGCEHRLRVAFCGVKCDPQPIQLYDKIPVKATAEFYGGGWDIGAHQDISRRLSCDLVVCLVTTTYFRRNNWLKPIVDAFELYGDGLYGTSASYQNFPHIRTGCFAFSPSSMREYPHLIDSREKSFYFESGQSPTVSNPTWNFTNWMLRKGKPIKLVTPDGCYDLPQFRKPLNIFRRGNQNNALVWDRHFDIYDKANPGEKIELESLADGWGVSQTNLASEQV